MRTSKNTFKKFYEATVIGLIEVIDIYGIGKIPAKVDSGNSAHPVIHGTDITRQGDKVLFTTVDGKRIIKDVVDMININIGGGHVEQRPVVTFRVKFAGQTFDNVAFSVGNRETNEYKVLIGRDFIKRLDALIDVNAKNISTDNIEVEY
jgi:hypothetical protein